MKLFLFVVLLVNTLYGATVTEVDEMFQKSQKCKACHLHLVNDWKDSWHSKSHFNSDEYFAKSIKYVSRKSRKSLNGVKIQCAKCHNPRIAVTSTGIDYEIDAVMGLDKGSKVNKALQSDNISEGINCVVCHNIDVIHSKKDASVRGIDRIEWTKSGLMSGPYNDANSPYHKVQYRDFMEKKSDNLCFVCHANDTSVKGLVFANMKTEAKDSKKMCVECHMGAKRMGVAATLKNYNGKAKKRLIRSHGFKGAHFDEMIKDSLSLSAWQKKDSIVIVLKNNLPHNVPSGFGSREILVELFYYKGKTKLKKEVLSLSTHYKDKRKRTTIPHLAKTQSKDKSVPAYGQKVLKVKRVKGATSVKIVVSYRLVNDEVRGLLKLKDAIWAKKMPIASTTLKLN